MTSLDRLGVLQFYPPKTKCDNKYGWKYVPMHMIFDVRQHDLLHKAGIVVGGHVMDYTNHTTYSSTIKYVSLRLMLLIAVKNGLGLMSVDIGNSLCMDPCSENIWFYCGEEFVPRCGTLEVLKRDL